MGRNPGGFGKQQQERDSSAGRKCQGQGKSHSGSTMKCHEHRVLARTPPATPEDS